MDDTLYELLVARYNNMKNNLLKSLVMTLMIVFALIAIFLSPIFFPVALIIDALLYIFVLPRFNVEYEYTLLRQDFDIDIIYNKSKRKKAVTLDLREAELIAPVSSSRLANFKTTATLDYSTGNPNDKPYAIILPLNHNLNKILIQPDTAMVQHLRNVAPRVTFMD